MPDIYLLKGHPLERLFSELANKRILGDVGIRNPKVADYIAELLTRFTHIDNLYKIRNARGRRLEEVGEMLIESHPLLGAPSFIAEREIRRHIGDYTLFMCGLFPEYVASLPRRRKWRLDSFLDYVKVGKESYFIVSTFDLFEFAEEAPLFRQLSDQFELCVYGLNLVKQDLERMQRERYLSWKQLIV